MAKKRKSIPGKNIPSYYYALKMRKDISIEELEERIIEVEDNPKDEEITTNEYLLSKERCKDNMHLDCTSAFKYFANRGQ